MTKILRTVRLGGEASVDVFDDGNIYLFDVDALVGGTPLLTKAQARALYAALRTFDSEGLLED